MKPQRGFNLVEMAVVLVIIGMLLAGILASRNIIGSTQAKDAMTIIDDLRAASAYFKQRYNYLPGDWPYVAGAINGVTSAPGNGDGQIAGTINAQGQAAVGSEAAVAAWQLYNAGFIGKIDTGDPQRYLKTIYGSVHLVSAASSGLVFPASVRNVILFTNLPCEVVHEIEIKMDDGNYLTGRGLGTNVGASCPSGTTVPFYGVPLE